ncbi:radical SAM protein [Desulfogranum japonicum]|uniref:radical SAM protein n=1 Tax=Desulfogranum japonicum TaxID=231447 RepID=UPI0003F6FA52|nr:radical SAM protein [Desulfogranum japonicum]
MDMLHPRTTPFLVFANAEGEILEYDGLKMSGSSAGNFYEPELEDLIELPEGSELFILPGRQPVGIELDSNEAALLAENPYEAGEQVQAVAAFMAPAHTALYTAGYLTTDSQSPMLPLFSYAAVGWLDGKFWVTGFRSDADVRQDVAHFNQSLLEKQTRAKLQRHPHNRLIQHLGKCCLTYCCPAAKNYFLNRWEAPLPCSPQCNASCIGCISLQPSGCCASTQDRITFVPTPLEIAEIAVEHLETAEKPIVSFGQGCEGEPLLQAEVMEKAIQRIRKATHQGTINLNTNGSLPHAVRRLAQAGLDSIRISLNSAREKQHTLYYRPKGFAFADVMQSIDVMKEYNRHVSLNYFILPGFTDHPSEFEALCQLITAHRPDFIQLRNLNIDPEVYLKATLHQADAAMGMRKWFQELRSTFPNLRYGYYNPPVHVE